MSDIKLQGVVVPPAGVTDGGLGAASSAFGQAARTALQIGDKLEALEIEEGKEQAIADAQGLDNNTLQTTKREKRAFDFLRVTDEAYANASEILALQRAESAAERHLTELEGKYAYDPEGYQKASTAWLGSYLKGDLPSDLVRQVEGSFAGMQKDGLARIAKTKRAADLKEAENGINARVEMTERKMDAFLRENGALGANDPAFIKMSTELRDQLAIKAGNPAFKYSEEEMERDLTKISDSMSKSVAFKTVVDLYDAAGGNEEAVTIAYKGIEEIVDALNLPSDEAQSTRAALRKEVNAKHELNKEDLKLMDAEEKRRKEFVAASLKIDIERGNASYGDIEKYRDDLSGAKYAELTLAVDRVNEKKVKERNAQAFGEALFDGTAVANPLDPKHQEALDTYFNSQINPLMQNSEDPTKVAVDFVKKTNVIPESMENGLVGQLLNGDVMGQTQSLLILSEIKEKAPIAYSTLASKPRRLASLATMYVDAGMAPEVALQRSRESLYVDDNIRKAREKTLTAKTMADVLKEGGKKLKIEGFNENRGAAEDYAAVYQAEYLATGDEDGAHYIAQEIIKTRWAETSFSENLMKNPPEIIHGVGDFTPEQNSEWLGQEFDTFLEGLSDEVAGNIYANITKLESEAHQGEYGSGFQPLGAPAAGPSGVKLISDELSDQRRLAEQTKGNVKGAMLLSDWDTVNGDRSYKVMVKTQDMFGGGPVYSELRVDGQPVRFKPDWETSAKNQEMQKERAEERARNEALRRHKVYGEDLPEDFYEIPENMMKMNF